MKRWCVRGSLEVGKDFCHVVTNPADSMFRAWAATTKQMKLTTKRRLHTLRHKDISNFGVPNHVPKRVTTVCASERRVSARRRLTSAWQFVCATWPHKAATHRGVTSRTKQCAHKAARHSPSQGHFIILGTETCSQNGHHSLRSRTERERAPMRKICAAILMAVR